MLIEYWPLFWLTGSLPRLPGRNDSSSGEGVEVVPQLRRMIFSERSSGAQGTTSALAIPASFSVSLSKLASDSQGPLNWMRVDALSGKVSVVQVILRGWGMMLYDEVLWGRAWAAVSIHQMSRRWRSMMVVIRVVLHGCRSTPVGSPVAAE